jgi:hypothetical protein
VISVGTAVEHADLGPGTVRRLLGAIASVDFLGETIEVDIGELAPRRDFAPEVRPDDRLYDADALTFRQAVEAINLGVVPPDPLRLIGLTIGGERTAARIKRWLSEAHGKGLCKVFFGFYGSGKSHRLQLVKAEALRQGWVVAFLEFDPKAADPGKPHLVYGGLMNGLSFPVRADGSRTEGFGGLVREIRKNWDKVRGGRYFRDSPWFREGMTALNHFPHDQDEEYRAAVSWLAGDVRALGAMRGLARASGQPPSSIPMMPQTRECSDIYVFHLVVLHEICQALGYAGLALVVDEAEHARNLNVRRRERANNLFDLMSRAAHLPLSDVGQPDRNEHERRIPHYWEHGPHFALFVGLTEGDTFADSSLDLREACVFLHTEDDIVRLRPPDSGAYEAWCERFFLACHEHLGPGMAIIGRPETRKSIATCLREAFRASPADHRDMRSWVKLAGVVPAILMSHSGIDASNLIKDIAAAAHATTTDVLPWELEEL